MNKDNQKVIAIILAAGMGSRMGLGYNKIFFNFAKPLICYTIEAFENNSNIDEIIIVSAKNEQKMFVNILNKKKYKKISKIVEGGETRQDSSRIGVENSDSDFVIVHDGARPFITQEIISDSIQNAKEFGSAIVAVPCKDTVKLAKENEIIKKTVDRSKLWMAQTPQTFQSDIILKAHQDAKENNFIGTDEASLIERVGGEVKLVMGSYDNIKVTTEEDLLLAQLIIDKYKL